MPLSGPRRLLAPLATLGLLATIAQAQGAVLVVGERPGHGVAFTDLQEALAAATDGDTILLGSGTHGPLRVSARSIVIAAEAGGRPTIRGTLEVSGLAPWQSFVLRGVSSGPVLVLDDRGAVLFEDCSIRGGEPGRPAVVVEGSERVSFVGSRLEGGGPALSARRSAVHLFDSVLLAGPRGTGPAADGGDGAVVDGSFLFASGCELRGGGGEDGVALTVPLSPYAIHHGGGRGGSGLVLRGDAPRAILLDADLRGGAGGPAPRGCIPGAPGPASLILAGELLRLGGTARSFTTASPVRELEGAALSLRGLPGDSAFAVLGLAPGASFAELLSGPLLIDLRSAEIVPLGPLPASGELEVVVPIPRLLRSDSAASLFVQPIFLDSTGSAVPGPVSALLILSRTL